ncbi:MULTISPECIES: formate dehydrogenase subunit alpha [Halolamina]|uniref:Formate dehydrogenase major subunit n=1 Tax=Halolamina pelagica TaxID=699431 RepID=A0A1I5NT80_9EURY|nr:MULTISPECIES: formate dehydrogenase subunit alpha [Halolamina]NHX36447.1 formate dehydrogenase subunit alpha [Halolamina sp. R1-12]SFP24506.1 formate dehydrogenase major subunit [Halolamina pelagica]
MSSEPVSLDLDRRSFLKASALAGAVALGGGGAGQALAQSDGEVDGTDEEGELTKTVCNFCAVGCGFRGERQGNAFVGQEPWHENPINNGSLCSKGAAIYGSEHSERRLKHPLIKEGDTSWRKAGWDEALEKVGNELNQIREEHGPDSVMWMGSAHFSNEESYAFRKLSSIFGTNNVDHQARICHSTTVSGLANTWGYGAMTNTINDYRNFDLNLIIGQNPAEAHPIAMQHILEGQQRGGDIAVVDPRFTKTAAKGDYYYRMRPGTDVALMMGLMKYLRDEQNLDREMLEERVMGWPDVEVELDQYDLETVEDITWVSQEQIRELGDLIAENAPKVQIEWAMGGTQHNNGTQNIRSYALTSLSSGSAAQSGGGLQVMRGHANVQGATDLAVASHILPGYYSVGSPGSWQYWSEVWSKSPFTSGEITFEELYDEYDLMPEDRYLEQSDGDEIDDSFPSERSMMFQKGMTVARWFDGGLPQEERLNETPLYQPDELKAVVIWGHSLNSISEMQKMKDAMDRMDLVVVVDVFPSVASVLSDQDNVVILSAASQYEHHRSLTNSHRSVQWSEPVRPPSHNTKPDLEIMQELADRFGFGDHFDWGSGSGLYNGKSTYEEVLREVNLGVRTIGYQQDPQRLQEQQEYDYAFSTDNLRCEEEGLPVSGEFWQLPWPCWGEGHPGTPIIWNDDLDPRNGGQDFRARWGVQAPTPEEWADMDTDKEYPMQETYDQGGEEALNLLRDPYTPDWESDFDNEVQGVPQYPGFATTLPEDYSNPDQLSLPYAYALDPDQSVYDTAVAMNERYGADFDEDFYAQYDFAQPDAPTGRGRARAVVWGFMDTVPVHREPVESPRPDLVEEWPANGQQTNFYRLDQNNAAVQERATAAANDPGDESAFSTVMTTGRQVEHQGGGAESRSNEYLADLQPHMYVEIHPNMAEEMGIDGGDLVVVSTTDRGSVLVKARVTPRPGHGPEEEEIFLPFHWGGIAKGEDLLEKYPDGNEPFAIGDSVNFITSRGYDVETQMQETKAAQAKVRPATQELVDELNMDVDLETFTFPQDEAGFGQQKDFDTRDNTTVQ